MHPLALIPIDKLLAASALLPAAGVVAYGSFISVNVQARLPSQQQQDLMSHSYTLSYADGQKATFKTDYGTSLVLIGSPLGETGRITRIAKLPYGWAVSTSKGYIFTASR